MLVAPQRPVYCLCERFCAVFSVYRSRSPLLLQFISRFDLGAGASVVRFAWVRMQRLILLAM